MCRSSSLTRSATNGALDPLDIVAAHGSVGEQGRKKEKKKKTTDGNNKSAYYSGLVDLDINVLWRRMLWAVGRLPASTNVSPHSARALATDFLCTWQLEHHNL